jgi:aryl carrier-like protein
LTTIIRTEPLPPRTGGNGRTSTRWNELIEQLQSQPLNGNAALIAEGLDSGEVKTMTYSLRRVFKSRSLPFRARSRKVNGSHSVYVVRDDQ